MLIVNAGQHSSPRLPASFRLHHRFLPHLTALTTCGTQPCTGHRHLPPKYPRQHRLDNQSPAAGWSSTSSPPSPNSSVPWPSSGPRPASPPPALPAATPVARRSRRPPSTRSEHWTAPAPHARESPAHWAFHAHRSTAAYRAALPRYRNSAAGGWAVKALRPHVVGPAGRALTAHPFRGH